MFLCTYYIPLFTLISTTVELTLYHLSTCCIWQFHLLLRFHTFGAQTGLIGSIFTLVVLQLSNTNKKKKEWKKKQDNISTANIHILQVITVVTIYIYLYILYIYKILHHNSMFYFPEKKTHTTHQGFMISFYCPKDKMKQSLFICHMQRGIVTCLKP